MRQLNSWVGAKSIVRHCFACTFANDGLIEPIHIMDVVHTKCRTKSWRRQPNGASYAGPIMHLPFNSHCVVKHLSETRSMRSGESERAKTTRTCRTKYIIVYTGRWQIHSWASQWCFLCVCVFYYCSYKFRHCSTWQLFWQLRICAESVLRTQRRHIDEFCALHACTDAATDQHTHTHTHTE